MDIFLVDKKRNVYKTYNDLLHDLNTKNTIRNYIYYNNPYEVFLELIYSLIIGYEVVILDGNFTEEEIKKLGLDLIDIRHVTINKGQRINDYRQLIDVIEMHKEQWKLSIFTSGTTGKPKKVTYSFDNMIRNIKTGNKYSNNIWAFAYNPTHFAGLQVFFQAFLNRNPIIFIFDYNTRSVYELLLEHQITHISATPTFYRTILSHIEDKIETVKNATFGGEEFDKQLKTQINNIFPNASVRNIYALTEAGTIFGSINEYFVLNDNIRELVKLSKKNELLIHKKLLSNYEDIKLNNDWYHTGDIFEFISPNKIRFVNRKNTMINVGGYKVNPNDIESEIKKIDGVIDVVVKGRKNRITGNILVAEVVISNKFTKEIIEETIFLDLSKKFQKWKIPRIIKFVEELNKTRTGKKVRR